MKNIKTKKSIIGFNSLITVSTLFIGIIVIYLSLLTYFNFDKISSFIYLKLCGVEILNQNSPDGENVLSTVRINKYDRNYQVTLFTNFKCIIQGPVKISELNNNSLVQLDCNINYYSIHSNTPPPQFNINTGIDFNEPAVHELFPFEINCITDVFSNIQKIDSVLQAIPVYPNSVNIAIDKSHLFYFSRIETENIKNAIEEIAKDSSSFILKNNPCNCLSYYSLK